MNWQYHQRELTNTLCETNIRRENETLDVKTVSTKPMSSTPDVSIRTDTNHRELLPNS